MLHRLIVTDAKKTRRDLKRDLVVFDVDLSTSSITKHLIKGRRVARRPKTKQLLTKDEK